MSALGLVAELDGLAQAALGDRAGVAVVQADPPGRPAGHRAGQPLTGLRGQCLGPLQQAGQVVDRPAHPGPHPPRVRVGEPGRGQGRRFGLGAAQRAAGIGQQVLRVGGGALGQPGQLPGHPGNHGLFLVPGLRGPGPQLRRDRMRPPAGGRTLRSRTLVRLVFAGHPDKIPGVSGPVFGRSDEWPADAIRRPSNKSPGAWKLSFPGEAAWNLRAREASFALLNPGHRTLREAGVHLPAQPAAVRTLAQLCHHLAMVMRWAGQHGLPADLPAWTSTHWYAFLRRLPGGSGHPRSPAMCRRSAARWCSPPC